MDFGRDICLRYNLKSLKNAFQKLGIFLSFFFGFLISGLVGQELGRRELIALLELRARTHGNEWVNVWDLKTPVSSWYGVRVKDGKLVSLDLSNNNLRGNLPLTIGNLTHLEYLDLSGNKLSGRMPRELRKFDCLWYLDLSGNNFKGRLSKTLNRLVNLTYLD